MLKKHQKTLFLIFGAFSLLSIVYIYSSIQPKEAPTTSIDTTPIPTRSLSFLSPENTLPPLTVKPPKSINSRIPLELPTYTTSISFLNTELAQKIAKNLGFNGPPQQRTTNSIVTSLIWEKPNFERVSIFLPKRTINYTNESLNNLKLLNQESTVSNINKFLSNFDDITNSKLYIHSINYFKYIDDENKSISLVTQSNVAEVKISQKIDGLPIIGLNFDNTFSDIKIIQDQVYTAHIILPSLQVESKKINPLISSTEILEQFDNAILISFNHAEYAIRSNEEFPEEPLTTTDTYLAYYYQISNSTFFPVLVINADGRTSTNVPVTAVFVLPLTKAD